MNYLESLGWFALGVVCLVLSYWFIDMAMGGKD